LARNKLTAPLILALAPLALAASGTLADEPQPPVSPQAQVSLMGPGLWTEDLDAAFRFYTEGLGLTQATRLEFGDTVEIILSFGAEPRPPMLMLLGPKDAEHGEAVPSEQRKDKLVLAVSDAEAARARLASAGYEPSEIHVHEQSGTRVFWATDPDGHRLEITQPPNRAQ